MPVDSDFMPIIERLCKEISPFENDFILEFKGKNAKDNITKGIH